MPQTILTLISELQPARAEEARSLVVDLRRAVEAEGAAQSDANGESHLYAPLVTSLPGLHFAAIMVFDDARFDPMVTLELNFDGPADAFLPRLQTEMLLPFLRAILRCCKPPEADAMRPLYDAAVGVGDITPYLRTLIVQPAVAHQGNRGLERDRILQEAALYASVQAALEAPDCRKAPNAVALHAALRAALAAQHDWLDKAPPERIPWGEKLTDIGRLAVFVVLLLAVLFVPGILLWALSPPLALLIECIVFPVVVAAVAGFLLWRELNPAAAPPRAPQLPPAPTWMTPGIVGLLAGVALFVLVCLLVSPLRAGLAGAILVIAAAAVALRRLEASDCVHERPQIDPERLREIMELEDQIAQNHMGSVVHVKPGALRAVLIRLGLKGLGLLLRVTATNGYLAQMRTIHFAHWALLDNSSRLLFFSNFDSSWESYLDDFIEKAHAGLTLAWSNCLGFPRTKFLVEEGATHGPLFKTWARHSMARGLFWVSAYPKLSVNQIERNCAIAAGLCARKLSPQAAETWAALL